MGILDKVFGKKSSKGPDLSKAECYVCKAPSYYKCEVCGRYSCMVHSKPGTRSCLDCFEKAQEKARPAVR